MLLGDSPFGLLQQGVKIATWNVNSLRSRAERTKAWLAKHSPDVLCLQETKVEDEKFPREVLESAGYHVTFWGQKAYNGVAIASKTIATDVRRGFGDGGDDTQARFIAATVEGWRVHSHYVPNGQAVGTEKYQYKLSWLSRLVRACRQESAAYERVVLCGDYNIAPGDLDVHDPEAWRDQVLCSALERQQLSDLLAAGYVDGFRILYPDAQTFSWWDYRGAAFFRDHGLRIDHVLCNPGAHQLLEKIEIDREERKGQGASDHAPVTATFREVLFSR